MSESSNPRRPRLHVNVVVRPLTVFVPRLPDMQAAAQGPQADADERAAYSISRSNTANSATATTPDA